MKNLRKPPLFKSEKEERDFWLNHDTTDYLDQFKPVRLVFPNLKPSTKTITLRLPEMLLSEIRQLANSQDVPYQSYMKILLSEKVKELRATT